jgi:hypothetical protein
MAFTFDSTPTSGTMNSYTSVSFADDYFVARFGAESWASFDEPKKFSLLVQATNLLDTFVYGGLRTSRSQPLAWPRQGIYNDEGTAYSTAVVPVKMEKATCEMAFWLFTEEDRLLNDTSLQQVEVFKAGPLDLKVRKNAMVIPDKVIGLITSIGAGTLISTGQSEANPKTSMGMNL